MVFLCRFFNHASGWGQLLMPISYSGSTIKGRGHRASVYGCTDDFQELTISKSLQRIPESAMHSRDVKIQIFTFRY